MSVSNASVATNSACRVLEEMDPKNLIDGLEEWVRWRARGLLLLLALAGYGRAKVICGYRSLEECLKQYGQGRTESELVECGISRSHARPNQKKVTWILPQYNRHVRRLALDIDLTMYVDLDVDAIDRLARSVGMIYGGVWSVRDTYHFEV